MNVKSTLISASFLLAIGVILGAFGAHALEDKLTPERLETWKTAVDYQMWNTLGLMGIGIITSMFELNTKLVPNLILGGILVFSGSLYILCLTDIGWFGAITPIGGSLMILGWIVFGIKLVKAPTIISK